MTPIRYVSLMVPMVLALLAGCVTKPPAYDYSAFTKPSRRHCWCCHQ